MKVRNFYLIEIKSSKYEPDLSEENSDLCLIFAKTKQNKKNSCHN